MITLHHLNNSRSHRIIWLLEELGADYEIKHYQRDADMRAPDSLIAVHPLGKSPVVTTDDGAVLAESGALIEELLDMHDGALRPSPGTPEHRRFRYFLHYAEGSFAPPLLVKLITGKLRDAPVPFFVKPIPRAIAKQVDDAFTDEEIRRNLAFLEGEVSNRPFLAGEEFTAADIQVWFPLEGAAGRSGLARYPKLAAYLDKLRARPALKKAMEIGGPLALS